MKTQEEILAKDKIISFKSEESVFIIGRGKAFITKLPFTCHDFDWIIGQEAIINDEKHTIVAVERRMHASPWRTGETITLLVKDFASI